MKVLTKDDYKVTKWSGGTTTQIFIWPEGADYAERNFEFRISSATVEDEESTFTILPKTHRFLTVLEGKLDLTFNEATEVTLEPGKVVDFEGEWNTKSVGIARDFNLMVKKGRGDMRVLNSRTEEKMELKVYYHFFYGIDNGGKVKIAAEEISIEKGCCLHLTVTGGESLILTGKFIYCGIEE